MAYKITYNTISIGLCAGLDSKGDVKESIAWTRFVYSARERLFSYLKQLLCVYSYLSYTNSHGSIAIIIFPLYTDINAYDISFFQNTFSRDTMDHLFINRSTDISGKIAIPFKSGLCSFFIYKLPRCHLQFHCGYTRLDKPLNFLECLGSNNIAFSKYIQFIF